MEELIAHITKDNQIQSLKKHSENTAFLCEQFLKNTKLNNLGKLCGYVHDLAKSKDTFQNYVKNDEVKKIDHSTGGGLYISEIKDTYIQEHKKNKAYANLTAQFSMMSIFCHHSNLSNILSNAGEFDYGKRLKCDKNKIDYDESVMKFQKFCINEETIQALYANSVKETYDILYVFKKFCKNKSECYFATGLLQRLIFSSLIDADKYDTYCFFSQISPTYQINRNDIWQILCKRLETYISSLQRDTEINKIRSEISETCKNSATGESGIYRLLAPTGSGKTMASLRFALHHVI